MELHLEIILILVIFNCNGFIKCDYASKISLKKELFDNYDKDIPPIPENKTKLAITVDLFGAIVIEVKETEQVTSYLVAHNQKWKDHRLVWSPSKHSGIDSIVVPVGKIWRPDTYIYNSVEVKDIVNEDRDLAKVIHTGDIEIMCPQYIRAFCTVSVHMFPFDTQFCTVAITSNQIGNDELSIKVTKPDYQKFKFTGNSEWELCNVSMVVHDLNEIGLWGLANSIEYQYIFQIRRRATYYVTVIIIPIFLISTLSIVGIFAPGSDNETGNCVNLGLGTLLALMVLLGIVADRLPKSDDMPLLGYYILAILISFVFCVIFETAMLYYSHSLMQDGKPPPRWLYKNKGYHGKNGAYKFFSSFEFLS